MGRVPTPNSIKKLGAGEQALEMTTALCKTTAEAFSNGHNGLRTLMTTPIILELVGSSWWSVGMFV
jgi:hypothetical protein